MAINIKLELDEHDAIRKMAMDAVAGAVRNILRQDLQGIVTAELAKLRLLDANSKPLSDLIEQGVKDAIRTYVESGNVRQVANTIIANEVRSKIDPMLDAVRKNLATQIANKILQ